MGVGIGIALLAAGLILVLDVVNVGTTWVDEGQLGWILIVVGALALVVALAMSAMGRREHITHVHDQQ